MTLRKFWKIGTITTFSGLIAIIGAACSSQPATPPPPVTVTATVTTTVTPPAPANLIIDANTVSGAPGAQGVTPNVAGVCVVTSQYKPTNEIVWRIKVFDPVTGKPLDDKSLKSVQVKLADGKAFTAQYGGHPGSPGAQITDYFWTTAWTIPADYPTGSLQYQISAQGADGRTGAYNQFNVAPSLLTIVK